MAVYQMELMDRERIARETIARTLSLASSKQGTTTVKVEIVQ